MRRVGNLFITATKIHSWGGYPSACCVCGDSFRADVVYDEVDKPIYYWVGTTWTHPNFGAKQHFCWECASVFLRGDYRGDANNFEVDTRELSYVLQRVAGQEMARAYNIAEAANPGLEVQLIEHRAEMAQMMASAHVVSRSTFETECRDKSSW